MIMHTMFFFFFQRPFFLSDPTVANTLQVYVAWNVTRCLLKSKKKNGALGRKMQSIFVFGTYQ